MDDDFSSGMVVISVNEWLDKHKFPIVVYTDYYECGYLDDVKFEVEEV